MYYRTILPFIYFIASINGAPRESDITYVKINPINANPRPENRVAAFRESRIENIPLVIPGVIARRTRSDHTDTEISDTTTEIQEFNTDVTESMKSTEAVTELPEVIPEVTKPPRKFYSKLNYFQKSTDDFLSTNLIEVPAKRKYRSKCRCERIWNCPKLQITVPRCPEEYFLCCF